MNSDFWWAAEARERPRNSVAGALPWSPMASHRGTARDRLEEEAVESQNPSRAGEPPKRRAKARQQQQQQARGQEKKADLTYQSNRVRPLNQSGVTPEIRQTTAPTREIRHLGTGPEGAPVGDIDVVETCEAEAGFRGDGREGRRERNLTWRRADGRGTGGPRCKSQEEENPFLALFTSRISFRGLHTRSLSLSRTRTGCCCFSVATTTGTGSGRGGKEGSLELWGGWPATKLKIEWIGGPSGAQRTGTGRRAGVDSAAETGNPPGNPEWRETGGRVCFWQLWAGPGAVSCACGPVGRSRRWQPAFN